jgi:hypothetical protein
VWCIVLQLDKESHPSRRPDLDIRITTHRFEPWPGPRSAVTCSEVYW